VLHFPTQGEFDMLLLECKTVYIFIILYLLAT
jgi:hypothetical protein